MLRDPLFDLDNEDVILELRRKLAQENSELKRHVRAFGTIAKLPR